MTHRHHSQLFLPVFAHRALSNFCHPERAFCAKDLNRPRQQPIRTAPPLKNFLISYALRRNEA